MTTRGSSRRFAEPPTDFGLVNPHPPWGSAKRPWSDLAPKIFGGGGGLLNPKGGWGREWGRPSPWGSANRPRSGSLGLGFGWGVGFRIRVRVYGSGFRVLVLG